MWPEGVEGMEGLGGDQLQARRATHGGPKARPDPWGALSAAAFARARETRRDVRPLCTRRGERSGGKSTVCGRAN